VALYHSKRPVKNKASETQVELDKVTAENKKLRLRVHDLEKKLKRVEIDDNSTQAVAHNAVN